MSCRNCTYFTRICFGFQRFPYRDKESNVLGLTWILSSSRAGELLIVSASSVLPVVLIASRINSAFAPSGFAIGAPLLPQV